MTTFSGGPRDSPGYLLWHVTLRWQRNVTAALAPLGLTHVQFVLLTCLWWLAEQPGDEGEGEGDGQKTERRSGHDGHAPGGSPNQLALARQAGTDVKMTSQVLGTLERKGLVERRTDPVDTRAKTVHLTASGQRLAEQAVVVVEAVDAEFFARPSEPAARTASSPCCASWPPSTDPAPPRQPATSSTAAPAR